MSGCDSVDFAEIEELQRIGAWLHAGGRLACEAAAEHSWPAGHRRIMLPLSRRGAEAILLGCTEIDLLVGPEDSPVPVFDTTRLHAQCAVELALAAELTGVSAGPGDRLPRHIPSRVTGPSVPGERGTHSDLSDRRGESP